VPHEAECRLRWKPKILFEARTYGGPLNDDLRIHHDFVFADDVLRMVLKTTRGAELATTSFSMTSKSQLSPIRCHHMCSSFANTKGNHLYESPVVTYEGAPAARRKPPEAGWHGIRVFSDDPFGMHYGNITSSLSPGVIHLTHQASLP
jgi:hypothetical protein